MAKQTSGKPMGLVFAEQLRSARARRGWSQEELAAEVRQLGVPMDRTTIAKIEGRGSRARNVTVEDAVVLAAALHTSPLALILPLGSEDLVQVAPSISVHPDIAAQWMEGEAPLADSRQVARVGPWQRMVAPLRMYRQLRTLQRAVEDAQASVRQTEYAGNEKRIAAARSAEVGALKALADHLARMVSADVRTPGLPDELIEDMRSKAGIDTEGLA